jgi:fused signal recognition particle receptor
LIWNQETTQQNWHKPEWYNSPVEKYDWKDALSKTRKSTFGRIATLFGATELSHDFWDKLEVAMVSADLGIELSTNLITELRDTSKQEGLIRTDHVYHRLRSLLISHLQIEELKDNLTRPSVTIFVGVNGSGKTTTVGRFAYRMKQAGKTYRAAANEQLAQWADRLDIDIIHGRQGSDPGAVVYNASEAALSRNIDVLLIDTSGRMHTHHNLMAELQKVCRVAGKLIPDSPHDVLLVLDATTGQNGIAQAKAFSEAIGLTGVVIAKLDSSARGGIGFRVVSELKLPILYVGLGEGINDLHAFKSEEFVDGLLEMPETIN